MSRGLVSTALVGRRVSFVVQVSQTDLIDVTMHYEKAIALRAKELSQPHLLTLRTKTGIRYARGQNHSTSAPSSICFTSRRLPRQPTPQLSLKR
eukprot:scaffold29295_cov30-Tisochrysis_lutea.AAC.1